jgi:flagellar basal-body rod modification protein FlgD
MGAGHEQSLEQWSHAGRIVALRGAGRGTVAGRWRRSQISVDLAGRGQARTSFGSAGIESCGGQSQCRGELSHCGSQLLVERSANDFLTLLVTEMQNQDPTADVDPNAYIDQLVQINSLEQLISINQNLAAVLGAASTTSTPSSSSSSSSIGGVSAISQSLGASTNDSSGATGRAQGVSQSPTSAVAAARAANRPTKVQGNLSAPGAAPAASTVSRALDGRHRGAGHGIRDIPTRALP